MADWSGNYLDLGSPLRGGPRRRLRLTPDERARHLYVVGSSGYGKSRFLESLIRQDIVNWPKSQAGLLFIDPDGETFDRLMRWLVLRQGDFVVRRPIVPIDLRRTDTTVAYNPLRARPGVDPSVVVDDVVAGIANVWASADFRDMPLLEETVRGVVRALYEVGGTLPDGSLILSAAERSLREALGEQVSDPEARGMLRRANDLAKKGTHTFLEYFGAARRRFALLSENTALTASLGSGEPSLDLAQAVEDGSIILVCLSQQGGQVGIGHAQIFAALLLSDLWLTMRQRGKGTSRKPFYVYIDEFQDFLLPSITKSFNQARGYGLHFTVAHQFPSQLLLAGDVGKLLYHSVIENTATKVAFRLQGEDLRLVSDLLHLGTYDPLKKKLELTSPAVAGFEKVVLEGWSETESSGGETEFLGNAVFVDEEGEPVSEGESSGSSTTSPQYSSTRSSHEHLMPTYEERVSSVQYFPLEEQRHAAMLALRSQNPRIGTVLMPGDSTPMTFRSANIPNVPLSDRLVEKYRRSVIGRLPIVRSRAEALLQQTRRQEALRRAEREVVVEHPLPRVLPTE